MLCRVKKAFTLIELLIVVAIIAILAAIAVPNFLEAQTRAKVSRVKSDMRSLATAIESYRIDWNFYPIAAQWVSYSPQRPTPDNFNNRMRGLTTPISYITSLPVDVFWDKTVMFPVSQGTRPTFEYNDKSTAVMDTAYPWNYNIFATYDAYYAFEGAGNTSLTWSQRSSGPDQVNDFQQVSLPITSTGAAGIAEGKNQTYDATNGTISRGDIVRTSVEQK